MSSRASMTPRASLGSVAATSLVVAGMICQDVGAAIAVTLFPEVGAMGMVTLRLVFSALILLLVFRPSLRRRSRADWLTVVGFGLVLATMNVLFYLALSRLHLGVTVTIEVIGPLILSVATGKRASAWLWAVLALGGVLLFGRGGFDSLDPLGVLFAVGAGAAWAGYILLSERTGRSFARLDGLAIAMVIGSLAVLPFGIVTAGPTLIAPQVLFLGLAVAVLSSTIPYALELIALRRLPAAAFSILLSLSPAIAALAGLVLLGQRLEALDAVAIGLVIVASMGAVATATNPRRRPTPIPDPVG